MDEYGVGLQAIQEFSDRDFSCMGDYRKLICRPQDVDFELLEYTDPLEPLVQTDLMKLNGIKTQCKTISDGDGDSSKRLKESNDESKSSNESKVQRHLLGMRVKFTLPSSAYATIALRELMKRPTSSEFQGELKLE